MEQYRRHGYVDMFEFEYSKYLLYYAGAYYGYIYETEVGDVEERKFCWDSFDEMLGCVIEEVGKTWREILEELPAEKVSVYL